MSWTSYVSKNDVVFLRCDDCFGSCRNEEAYKDKHECPTGLDGRVWRRGSERAPDGRFFSFIGCPACGERVEDQGNWRRAIRAHPCERGLELEDLKRALSEAISLARHEGRADGYENGLTTAFEMLNDRPASPANLAMMETLADMIEEHRGKRA